MRFCWVFAALLSTVSHLAMSSSYQEELIFLAKEKKVAQEKQWQRLLFYIPLWYKTNQSLVFNEKFFLAKDGRTNPEAELEQTLAGFFQPDDQRDFSVEPPANRHPQCRFPARFYYLSQKLNFDFERIKKVQCERLEAFERDLGVGSISYVFSAGHLGSPASMMGHTFLRLHRKDARKGNPAMLDHAIGFSAITQNESFVTYALFGIFGGFPGRFTLVPYYYKIQEYNNGESRDLWEYELNLSEEQLRLLLYTIIDIGSNEIPYFYLDVNCASLLLALLEIANPDLNLTNDFAWWIVPADSVRTIYKAEGLVKKMHFRASSFTRYRERFALLDSDEKQCLDEMVSSNSANACHAVPSNDSGGRIRAYDAALELVDYREKLLGDRKPIHYVELRNSVLSARSQIREPSTRLESFPESRAPHSGHNLARVGLTTAASESRGLVSVFSGAQFSTTSPPQELAIPMNSKSGFSIFKAFTHSRKKP